MARFFADFAGIKGTQMSARHSMQAAIAAAALLLVLWAAASWLIARHSYMRHADAAVAEKTRDSTRDVHSLLRSMRAELDTLQGAAHVVGGLAAMRDAASAISGRGDPAALGYARRKRRWTADPVLARASRTLETMRFELNADHIFLIDARGYCIASSDWRTQASGVGTDFSHSARFVQAQHEGGGMEAAMDPATGAPALYFSAPVTIKGHMRGVAVVAMDLPSLAVTFGPTDAYVSDANGVIVAAGDPALRMRSLPGAAFDTLPAAVRERIYDGAGIRPLRVMAGAEAQVPGAVLYGADSMPYVHASAVLDPYGLTVHVREPLSALQSLKRERVWRGLLVASVGGVLILGVTFATLYIQFLRSEERALAESEAHFRTLIEQPLTGIYVAQNDRIVYANPQMCEIMGLPAEEVIGRDTLEFFSGDAAGMNTVRDTRGRLARGARGVSLVVPFQRRDGRAIKVSIHAVPGLWDGRPASFVMAADITERERHEEKLAEYVAQLERSMEGTLRAVSNMVEQRDPYTAGHERRVGLIAGAIAAELGWPAEKCHDLELIGLVHDIGKISVPTEILTKPGRLTRLEFNLVKVHAENGYQVLKDVQFRLPIAEIIRQHHERMDGTGYPQGLKGEAILPEARILAVADVVESMASDRPYRPAVGLEAALGEIEAHRGTSYDPGVVDALLRLIREKGYRLPA